VAGGGERGGMGGGGEGRKEGAERGQAVEAPEAERMGFEEGSRKEPNNLTSLARSHSSSLGPATHHVGLFMY
jgi:hypothetical protein